MTRSNFFFSFLLLLTVSSKSQTTDSIIGKWAFKEIANADKIDTSSLKMLQKVFGEMTIYLKPNKHYKTILFAKEEGVWAYSSDSKLLTLTANKGTESQLELSILTKETILVSFGKGKSIILTKVKPNQSDEEEEQVKNVELVSVTTKDICKKWFLKSRYVPGKTTEQTKMVTGLVEGTYFNFKLDKTYDVQLLKIKETGNWSLENDGKTLVLIVNNEKRIWNIKSVNENELILIKGNTEETWTFSSKEKKASS